MNAVPVKAASVSKGAAKLAKISMKKVVREAIDGDDRRGQHAHRTTIRRKVGAWVVKDPMALVGEESGCRGHKTPINGIRGGIVNKSDWGRRSPEGQHP